MIFSKELSKCDERQRVIVSAENKRKHIAHNIDNSKVFQYRIDGDIEPSGTSELRCDYFIENETKKTLYLIELKGGDIVHAVEQINDTIKRYSALLSGYKLFPRIVCSKARTHNIQTSSVLSLKRQYSTKIKENTIDENI